MRTIFINRFFHPDHSATSQLVSDLAFHLAEAGHDVVVVTSRQRIDDARAALPARERVRSVAVHRIWTTRFGRLAGAGRIIDYLSFYLFAGLRLARLCRRGDVIVAKTDPPLISVVAGSIAGLRGAHLINWLQDLFPEVARELDVRGLGPSVTRLLVRLRNRSLRRARMNVAVGAIMDRRLDAEGILAGRRCVIHNWVDGDVIGPGAAGPRALRAELGLGDRFVVAYSGNMGRAHEFETILEAAAMLADEPRVVFLFVGDGVRRPELEAGVRARRLENVRFAPYQPQQRLAASLALADAHLVTLRPRLEGLIVPSKFYGIAAAGRPTLFVGSPEGEIAHHLRDGNCGFCVGVGESGALKDHIMRLLGDAALRESLGRNARSLFESRFARGSALAAWAALILSRARRPKGGGRIRSAT